MVLYIGNGVSFSMIGAINAETHLQILAVSDYHSCRRRGVALNDWVRFQRVGVMSVQRRGRQRAAYTGGFLGLYVRSRR